MSEACLPLGRVLVVEDDSAQRTTLCDLLSDAGFEPVPCANGRQALDQAAAADFPVAVVDYRLPDLSGVQVLERMRELLGRVRVIIHTAYGSFESAKDALNLGAFAYVEKAGDPKRILSEVRRAVDETVAEAVWELDECLHSITEFAPDLILQLDVEGTVTFLNRPLAGHAPEDLLGTRLETWIDEDHRTVLERAVRTVFDEGEVQGCQMMLEGRDGMLHWYSCRLGPVLSGGRIVRTIVIGRDVSEEKQRQTVDELIRVLVQNAREALGPTGKLSIEIERVEVHEHEGAEKDEDEERPEVPAGHYLMVAVSDTGRGMPRESLDVIFEPFFTTKTGEGAAGLGLTRAWGLVAQLGGHIAVESEPGRGTAVRIYLPQPPPPPEPLRLGPRPV